MKEEARENEGDNGPIDYLHTSRTWRPRDI